MNLTDQQIEIMRLSIKTYGQNAQEIKCMEECFELGVELCKKLLGKCREEKLVDELADVLVTTKQCLMIYDNADVFSEYKSFLYVPEHKLIKLLSKTFDSIIFQERIRDKIIYNLHKHIIIYSELNKLTPKVQERIDFKIKRLERRFTNNKF